MKEEVNYIKHLNAVFDAFSKDSRLNPTHISLYVALFQFWNTSHFTVGFYINREEVMSLSKIGSKTTYHRCINELDKWGYLIYKPSHNPLKGSRIHMAIFGITDGQVVDFKCTNIRTSTGQAVVPIYKHIQTIENNKKQKAFKKIDFKSLRKNGKPLGVDHFLDNLKISSDKNYNEPL